MLKLKCLSLVSLCSTAPHHTLPYSLLSHELDLPTTREVEQLISVAIDQSLIDGRLDQRSASLSVHHCMGRDVSPEEVEGLRREVGGWVERVEGIRGELERKMKEVKEEGKEREERGGKEAEEEARIREVLKGYRDNTGLGGKGQGHGGHHDPLMQQAIHIVTGGKDKRGEGGGGGGGLHREQHRDHREGKQRKRGSSFFGAR